MRCPLMVTRYGAKACVVVVADADHGEVGGARRWRDLLSETRRLHNPPRGRWLLAAAVIDAALERRDVRSPVRLKMYGCFAVVGKLAKVGHRGLEVDHAQRSAARRSVVLTVVPRAVAGFPPG